MLEVVSTVRSPSKADHNDHGGGFDDDMFMVDDGDNLLDYIDFTSCVDVVPYFDADGDILPDLEVDPTDLLAEFDDDDACRRAHDGGGDEALLAQQGEKKLEESPAGCQEKKDSISARKNEDEAVLSAVTTEDSSISAAAASDTKLSASKKKTSSSGAGNNSHGKRKVKVDWTPELHRRFVQAVEQLGIDKAVPSRILEIMGIECLTRHNIASHLQKYRSHRKHLMAREAEAAAWAHKRRHILYAAGAPPPPRMKTGGAGPWVAPRPLHVWGHPPNAVELPPVWPPNLPRPWVVDPSCYSSYYYYWWHQLTTTTTANAASRKWGPQAVTQGTPCVTPPMPATTMLPRFPAPGTTMYRPPPAPPQSSKQNIAAATLQQQQLLQLDAHPSKESIDAAIGDVLVKPWLPLPLGLKPPSLDSVMSELHKHGIPNIPPPAADHLTIHHPSP